MRAVVTRVSSASVTIDGTVSGQIGTGYLVLLGIGPEDTSAQVTRLADKICHLRVFSDENGKMNLDLEAVGGALLVISQFLPQPRLPGGARPVRGRYAGGVGK